MRNITDLRLKNMTSIIHSWKLLHREVETL